VAGNDFAKVEGLSRTVPAKSAGGVQSVLLVAGILLVVALAFSGGYWLGKEHGAQIADSAEKARLVAQLKQQEQEMAKLREEAKQRRKDADVSTSKIGDLTFYNDLPKQSVTPAPLSGTGENPVADLPAVSSKPDMPATVTPQTSISTGDDLLRNIIQREMAGGKLAAEYVVQVASYRGSDEATPLLKQLDALGVKASVRPVDLAGKGKWFRVYVGPYGSRDEADKARQKIKKSLKIDGLVLRNG